MINPENYLHRMETPTYEGMLQKIKEAQEEAFNAGISACQKEVVARKFIILVDRFENLKRVYHGGN